MPDNNSGGTTSATSAPATQGESGKRFNTQTGNWATGAWQSTSTKDGKPMWISPEGETWLTPPPSDVVNNSQYLNSKPFEVSQGDFSSQGNTPARVGVDDRPWVNVMQPSAYEYGGKKGTDIAEENRYAGLAGAADARTGPQIAGNGYGVALAGDMGQDLASRQNQSYGLGQLQGIIEGRGPSVAAQQQAIGLSQAMQQQASIANSARGGGANLAAAQQAAANAAGNLSGNAVQQAGLLRAQEQSAAINNYGGMANAQRASDQSRAQLTGQLATSQAGLDLQKQAANDSRNLAYEQMRGGVFNAQMGAREAGEAANAGVFASNADRAQRADEAATAERDKIAGTAMTIGGGIIGTAIAPGAGTAAGAAAGGAAAQGLKSDVRAKKDIGDGAAAVRATIGGAAPYTYDYKNPQKDGAGKRIGVMAQDLEKGPLGKEVVRTGPDGQKVIDGPRGLGLALAATSDQEHRLRALEQSVSGGRGLSAADMQYATSLPTSDRTNALRAQNNALGAREAEARGQQLSGLARAQRERPLNAEEAAYLQAYGDRASPQFAAMQAENQRQVQLAGIDSEARAQAEADLARRGLNRAVDAPGVLSKR